jgi:hypothetical protein
MVFVDRSDCLHAFEHINFALAVKSKNFLFCLGVKDKLNGALIVF